MSRVLASVTSLGSKIVSFSKRYPVSRGMATYGVIWPTSCLIQQTLDGKRLGTYDWVACGRFCLYASCFTAPTLYLWIRVSTKLWPTTSFKTSVAKALVEQVTYGPSALVCFFFGMSILEGKTVDESINEVQTKFLPTYKMCICFWPFLQTINFYFIAERNRVMFVSMCSLVWATFLAYMKKIEAERLAKQQGLLI